MKTIRIANPRPGSSQYTSIKRAEEYVTKGMAIIRDGQLVFDDDRQILEMRKEAMLDAAMKRERGPDFVYGWNGNDTRPFVRHEPGRKVS